eukprot:gene28609-35486_t
MSRKSTITFAKQVLTEKIGNPSTDETYFAKLGNKPGSLDNVVQRLLKVLFALDGNAANAFNTIDTEGEREINQQQLTDHIVSIVSKVLGGVWMRLDVNASGDISESEWLAAFDDEGSLRLPPASGERSKDLDANQEAIAIELLSTIVTCEGSLLNVFRAVDTNHDSSIGKTEFMTYVATLMDYLVGHLWENLDEDSSGVVTYIEWIKAFHSRGQSQIKLTRPARPTRTGSITTPIDETVPLVDTDVLDEAPPTGTRSRANTNYLKSDFREKSNDDLHKTVERLQQQLKEEITNRAKLEQELASAKQ